jgi:hypothetical protein
VTDVQGIKSDNQFLNILEENIIQQSAPHKLISASTQVIASNKAQDILSTLTIKIWESEPTSSLKMQLNNVTGPSNV